MKESKTKIKNIKEYKNAKNKEFYLQIVLQLASEYLKESSSHNENVKNFINNCRNYLSHSIHSDKDLEESYRNLLVELKSPIQDIKRILSIEVRNALVWGKSNDNYVLSKIEELISLQKDEEILIEFILLIASSIVPSIWINFLCDKLSGSCDIKADKKIFTEIAKSNNQARDFDFSGLNWTLSDSNNKQTAYIKEWEAHFLKNAFHLLFPNKTVKIDNVKKDISNWNIECRPSLGAVRFYDPKNENEKYEISHKVLQQYLLLVVVENLKDINLKVKARKKGEKNKKVNSDDFRASFYKMWQDKRSWVDEEDFEHNTNRFKPVRSMTRFLCREFFKANKKAGKSTEDKEKDLLNYHQLYNDVSKELSKSWKNNKTINLGNIELYHINKEHKAWKLFCEKEFKEIDNKKFPEMYQCFCDTRLQGLGKFKGVLDNYFQDSNKLNLKEFLDQNPAPKLNAKQTDSKKVAIIDLLKSQKPQMASVLYRKDNIKRIKLPKEKCHPEQTFNYLTFIFKSKVKINTEISKLTADFLVDLEILKKKVNDFFALIEGIQLDGEGEKLDRLAKKERKAKLKEHYRWFELALLQILIYTKNEYADLIKHIERFALKNENESLYVKLGTTSKGNIYVKNDDTFATHWNKVLKNDQPNTVFESWHGNKLFILKRNSRIAPDDCLKDYIKEKDDRGKIYLLDKHFSNQFLEFYIYHFAKILKWEECYLKKLPPEQITELRAGEPYISFKKIVQKAGRDEELNEIRNKLVHLDLVSTKMVVHATSELEKSMNLY